MTDLMLNTLRREAQELQRRVSAKQKSITELERKMALENKPVAVTDHAILRYLERKLGFNIDAIRKEILTPERIAAIKTGTSKIRADGMCFVVKENVIITAIKE